MQLVDDVGVDGSEASRLAVSGVWVWTSSSSCLVMVAIRMTLSRRGFWGRRCHGWLVERGAGVGAHAVLCGWSSDSGCASVVLHESRSYRCRRTGPARKGGDETSGVRVLVVR